MPITEFPIKFLNLNEVFEAPSSNFDILRQVSEISIAGIVYLIYVPICIYGVYEYYVHKDWIVMQKRYQWITVFILINIFLSLIALPSLFFFSTSTIRYIYYGIIVLAINIGWKILWRLWCHYYDIKFLFAISNFEWKTLIDSTLTFESTQDWFLSHKTTYGKWSYFGPIYFFIVFIDFFLITMWDWCLPHSLQTYTFIFMSVTVLSISLIPISLIVYLRFITPTFNDNFGIKEETTHVLYCVCFGLCVVSLFSFLSFIMNNIVISVIFTMSLHFIWSTIYTVMIYIMTIWVIRKNEARWIGGKRGSSILNETPLLNQDKDELEADNDLMDVIHDDITIIPLFEILCNSTSYVLFVQHLSTEFNVEALLCLTEFIQYQQYILRYLKKHNIADYKYQKMDLGNESNRISLFRALNFSSNIPKSSIVWNAKESKKEFGMNEINFYNVCKEKAYALYQKYIKDDSDLNVMIDADTRNTLKALMENKMVKWMDIEIGQINLVELMYLFETICNKMYIMLTDSYQRFTQTKNYQKLNELVFEC